MPQQLSIIQMVFLLKMPSPFTYYVEADEETGKPRFFNRSCASSFGKDFREQSGWRVCSICRRTPRITYPEGKARNVKSVEWLDKSGKIRQVDHYNKYGSLLLKNHSWWERSGSLYQLPNQRRRRTYLENHLKPVVFSWLLPGQALRRFANRTERAKAFLLAQVLEISIAIGNHLSRLNHGLWKIRCHYCDVLPGNIMVILEDTARANAIIIPDKVTYEKAF